VLAKRRINGRCRNENVQNMEMDEQCRGGDEGQPGGLNF